MLQAKRLEERPFDTAKTFEGHPSMLQAKKGILSKFLKNWIRRMLELLARERIYLPDYRDYSRGKAKTFQVLNSICSELYNALKCQSDCPELKCD
jgi:hypothetical protein